MNLVKSEVSESDCVPRPIFHVFQIIILNSNCSGYPTLIVQTHAKRLDSSELGLRSINRPTGLTKRFFSLHPMNSCFRIIEGGKNFLVRVEAKIASDNIHEDREAKN